jgi:hypothetical protein
MDGLVTKEEAGRLTTGLLSKYAELGERGKVSKGTLAAAMGISRSRWSQIYKAEHPTLNVETFLSLNKAVKCLQGAFDEGVLPVSSIQGKPQADFAEWLGIVPPEE